MRLEDYTDEELIIQIRNFDSEIERLKNYRDLFEKQININNTQERINKNDYTIRYKQRYDFFSWLFV